MLGTWSEEHGRTAIVMQMQKVEATQERRDEPRGSITLVFHHGPESICLKIKRGRTPLQSALRSPRTAHITCDFHYPTCVCLCGKGAALCQTMSHWFLPAERRRPEEGDSYRPMDCVLIRQNECINCARCIFYILTFFIGLFVSCTFEVSERVNYGWAPTLSNTAILLLIELSNAV